MSNWPQPDEMQMDEVKAMYGHLPPEEDIEESSMKHLNGVDQSQPYRPFKIAATELAIKPGKVLPLSEKNLMGVVGKCFCA